MAEPDDGESGLADDQQVEGAPAGGRAAIAVAQRGAGTAVRQAPGGHQAEQDAREDADRRHGAEHDRIDLDGLDHFAEPRRYQRGQRPAHPDSDSNADRAMRVDPLQVIRDADA